MDPKLKPERTATQKTTRAIMNALERLEERDRVRVIQLVAAYFGVLLKGE